jgi:hypothetical protein
LKLSYADKNNSQLILLNISASFFGELQQRFSQIKKVMSKMLRKIAKAKA